MSVPRPRRIFVPTALCFALLAAFFWLAASSARAYSLEGRSWPSGSQIVIHLALGNAPGTLQDGNTSYDAAVLPVMNLWNSSMSHAQIRLVADSSPAQSAGDRVNSVFFSNTVYGQSFGRNTLAVTYYSSSGANIVESDTLFNNAVSFDSYRGALQYPGRGGYAIADIRRVFLHEVGHTLGLGHPDTAGQHVTAVMNSIISDVETVAADDAAGIQSLYGAPSSIPSADFRSHLANISTRANVGAGNDVLIGGFIVSGSDSKKLILRAIGPSLTAGGIANALADPVLELHNSAGATIATNDDWISSAQQSEITNSGVAPSNQKESAIVATLAAGSYTAIVRGANNTAGVALVEAYELDNTTTRLVNLSTRGRVGVSDQALIGGIIVQGSSAKSAIVRALGPSLGRGAGAISGALTNPSLELRDSSGNLIANNDNWASGAQASQISSAGLAPSDPAESALLATLSPGSYTAIVRGANNETGIGLVEFFDLDQ